jgi:diacylglycerol kinase family enzyme
MGLVKAANLQPTQARVLLPDGEVVAGEILVMAVGNSRFAGGGFEVAPKADLSEGLLDLVALGNPSLAKLGQLIDELADPSGEGHQTFFYRQLDRFVLETDRPFHINLDGEPFINRRFEFDVLNSGVQVVLGDSRATQSAQ